MLVSELIERLKKLPQDVEVIACGDNPPTIYVAEVEFVEGFYGDIVFQDENVDHLRKPTVVLT